MRTEFEIVIVGGGLVGSVLARALALEGWQVAVVEAAPVSRSPSFDERVTALSEGSWRYLASLGLDSEVLHRQAEPIREVRVSDRGHLGLTRIHADEMGVAALGRVVANRHLQRAFTARPAPVAITTLQPARFVGLNDEGERVRLRIETDEGERSLSARLLVAADGVNSSVREALGIQTRRHDYGQDAIIARVMPARAHDGIAFERFTDSGPLAVLPMHEGQCSVVWTAWRDEAGALMELGDDAFAHRLQDRFGYRLGRLRMQPGRDRYPLTLTVADALVAGRCVIIGNAAHGLHPVAGQGLNLCLRDVRRLVDALRPARAATDPTHRHGDPGDPTALAAYAAGREQDYRQIITLTNGLVTLFSMRSPLANGLVGPLRGLGLGLMDKCPPIKKQLARLTMGV